MGDEELYLKATNEVEGDSKDPALWAKAMALTGGDQDKAKYEYIKLRVEQLAKSKPDVQKEYGVREAKADAASDLQTLRKQAEAGDAAAQYNLGVAYDNGEGVPEDDIEAVKWYRKAAEQGDAEAQNNLGAMYANGEGMPRNYAEAMKWYRKAAEQGDAEAQNNLGVMYENGEGVLQDKVAAVKWYRKAADQGHAAAQYNLGLRGDGVRQDKGSSSRNSDNSSTESSSKFEVRTGPTFESNTPQEVGGWSTRLTIGDILLVLALVAGCIVMGFQMLSVFEDRFGSGTAGRIVGKGFVGLLMGAIAVAFVSFLAWVSLRFKKNEDKKDFSASDSSDAEELTAGSSKDQFKSVVIFLTLVLVGFSVLFFLARDVGTTPQEAEHKISELMEKFEKIAKRENQGLPKMVDEYTRLDAITTGPDRRLSYRYTLVKTSSRDRNLPLLRDQLGRQVKDNGCENFGFFKAFFQIDGIVEFVYTGRDGVRLASFEIDRNDCGF